MNGPPRPQRFTPAFRLRHKREYDAVYAAKARVEEGPLVLHALPRGGGPARIGLAIGRRVGNAARRNRVKRLLREAFRLERANLPGTYDLVVGARSHGEVPLDTYRAALRSAVERLHALWTRRQARQDRREALPGDPTSRQSAGEERGSPSPPEG
jgi:ribonuclease P protein component